ASLPARSLAKGLLERFPPPFPGGLDSPGSLSYRAAFVPPASLDRYVGVQRVDWIGGPHRVLGRAAVSSLARPEFIWTPYRDFVSGLYQNSTAAAAAWIAAWTPRTTNELRAGYSVDSLGWDRPHREIPNMYSFEEGALLPGSPASYAYRNGTRN